MEFRAVQNYLQDPWECDDQGFKPSCTGLSTTDTHLNVMCLLDGPVTGLPCEYVCRVLILHGFFERRVTPLRACDMILTNINTLCVWDNEKCSDESLGIQAPA